MRLNWGIIGAGAIAQAFATAAKTSLTGKLVAVASRDEAKARTFGQQYGVSRCYEGYEQLLADKDVQAVYVCTPHPMHAQWAIAALEAGKHVLCEKPFSLNLAEARRMIDVAQRERLMIMEAFMYRCHPQTAKVVELLREKVLGEVRAIGSTFSFYVPFDAQSRLYSNELAGGGILDVGAYAVSYARLIAGVALGGEFADPLDVKGVGHIGQTGVDEWAAGVLRFPGDIVAQVACGVGVSQENVLRVYGTQGRMLIGNPWMTNRQTAEAGRIIVQKNGLAEQVIDIAAERTSFGYEIDIFGNAVADGTFTPAHPAMSNQDTLGNMQTLDAWRREVGCKYDREKAE